MSGPLPTTTTQFYVALQAYLNAQGPTQNVVAGYESPDALTAQAWSSNPVVVPPNTTAYEINLPAMFPAMLLPLFVGLLDASQPGVGFKWYTDPDGTNKQTVAPSTFMAWMADGATPLAPIYVDNPSAVNNLVIVVSVTSN